MAGCMTLEFRHASPTPTATMPSPETIVVQLPCRGAEQHRQCPRATPQQRVAWTWNNGTPQIVNRQSPANVTIVEPTLSSSKTAAPPPATPAIRLPLRSMSPRRASNAYAYNAVVTDAIPARHDLCAGLSDQYRRPGPDHAWRDAGGTVTATWNSFPTGSTSTLPVPGHAGLHGYARADHHQLRNHHLDQPARCARESSPSTTRCRSNGPATRSIPAHSNTYTDTKTAVVTVDRPVIIGKTVVTSSEASTHRGTQLTIGEIVRYRLQATVIEGTTPQLRLVDHLPLGLTLLDPGQVKVSFTANNAADAAGGRSRSG